MTDPHMAARLHHLSRCMTVRTSPSRPVIRTSRASSVPLLPWSIPTNTPSPPQRPPIGNPNAMHPPLLCVPISTGFLAWTSRKCLGYKPQPSISSAQRWASIGIHGRLTRIVPPGEDSGPITRCVAVQSCLQAVGGSNIGPVAPCAWPPTVSARAPALWGHFFVACAAHWGRPQRRRPQPLHSPQCSLTCARSKPPLRNAVPHMLSSKSRSVRCGHDASTPSTSDVLWGLKQAMHPQAGQRDADNAGKNTPSDARRARVIHAQYGSCSPLSLHSPGSETDAPLVALSPCVRVVPSAHGCVTGAASGLGRTAIPSRRLSACSTRAWALAMDQETYDLAS